MAWQLGWLCYITTHVTWLRAHGTYPGWLICTRSSCRWSYIDGLCHCKFHIRRGGSTGSNELFCPACAEGCGKTELDRFEGWRLFPSARPLDRFLKSRLYHLIGRKCLIKRRRHVISLLSRKTKARISKVDKGNIAFFISFHYILSLIIFVYD